jgi:hypothetical protein
MKEKEEGDDQDGISTASSDDTVPIDESLTTFIN